jgi:hypothetical protein
VVRDADGLQRAVVTPAQRGVIEEAVGRVGKDELVGAGEDGATGNVVEDPGDLIDQRDRACASGLGHVFGGEAEGAAHVHDAPLEVHVAPAQRAQLAEA